MQEDIFLLIPKSEGVQFPVLITRKQLNLTSGITGSVITAESAMYLLLSTENAKNSEVAFDANPVLAAYFYLVQQPLSVSFIYEWFVEAGQNESEATALAEFIYMARLERDDDEIEQFVKKLPVLKECDIQDSTSGLLIPENTTEALAMAYAKKTGRRYSYYDPLNENLHSADSVLLMEKLHETNYLIEDEDHLLLGLSLPLITIMVATSGPLPAFNKWLKRKTHYVERTHLTLGHILANYYSCSLRAFTEDGARPMMVSVAPDAGCFQHPLNQDWNNNENLVNIQYSLPLFLMLFKHQQTN